MADSNERYSRQERLPEVGPQGQQRLAEGAVTVVGCGALGAMIATALVRSGVGLVRVADRDVLELHNLHRQVLYDEQDVASGLPKAELAARHLRRINSEVQVEGAVLDVTAHNIEGLIADVDLVLDGTDNFETRYLINDACVKLGKPWIYGGVVGTSGMVLPVLPGQGPCLRCLFPQPPAPGSLPTCETRGVLGPLPMVVGALQATRALALLMGQDVPRALLNLNLWDGSTQQVEVLADEQCPACVRRQFDFLETRRTAWVTSLCGRDAVQITPPGDAALDLAQLQQELSLLGQVSFNGLLLQLTVEQHQLLLFPDGRVIVKGTTDEAVARSLYARYVGT